MRLPTPAAWIRRRSRRVQLTPADRIRRLRRRITLLFALVSAAGLIGVTILAVRADDVSWRDRVDADLELVTGQLADELAYDEDGDLEFPNPEEGAYDCPPVLLFTRADERLAAVAGPHRPCLEVPAAATPELAAAAAEEEEVVWSTVRAKNGHLVRMSARPYPGPESEADAVVVAAMDISGDQATHRRLSLLLMIACALLVAGSACAGHWLSGRAVRPALAALDQQEAFFADAAHDLRTPVASLRVLAETGLRGEADSTEVMRRTLRQATRMSELVDDLLTRARLMAGGVQLDREPLRLDQLVEAVAADTPTDGHRVCVRAEPVVVLADAGLLRRAVANLLGNALAHGHHPDRPADVLITVDADGTVAVDDAGPGIPPGQRHSLFERFHSGTGSSGLGLSIAAWVAHVHGGSLSVTASIRGGARFTLKVPTQRRT